MNKFENEMDAIMAFLDTDTYEEKWLLLSSVRELASDHLIDTLAASMDTVIEDGNIDKRFEDLMSFINMQRRFEVDRSRRR